MVKTHGILDLDSRFLDYLTPLCKDLLMSLLETTPSHRIDAKQLFVHPWLNPPISVNPYKLKPIKEVFVDSDVTSDDSSEITILSPTKNTSQDCEIILEKRKCRSRTEIKTQNPSSRGTLRKIDDSNSKTSDLPNKRHKSKHNDVRGKINNIVKYFNRIVQSSFLKS